MGGGISGGGVLIDFGSISLEKEKKIIPIRTFSLEVPNLESGIVNSYLENRRIHEHIIRDFELQGASLFGCFAVAFPIVSPLRKTEHWGYRLICHSELRYYTPFPKHGLIYGHAKVLTARKCCVMEGPFDVICSDPFQAIAALGKSLDDDHISTLKYFTCEEFFVCLDGSVDPNRKFKYALKIKMETGKPTFIIELPPGLDPGEVGKGIWDCPRSTPEEYLQRVKQSGVILDGG